MRESEVRPRVLCWHMYPPSRNINSPRLYLNCSVLLLIDEVVMSKANTARPRRVPRPERRRLAQSVEEAFEHRAQAGQLGSLREVQQIRVVHGGPCRPCGLVLLRHQRRTGGVPDGHGLLAEQRAEDVEAPRRPRLGRQPAAGSAVAASKMALWKRSLTLVKRLLARCGYPQRVK